MNKRRNLKHKNVIASEYECEYHMLYIRYNHNKSIAFFFLNEPQLAST